MALTEKQKEVFRSIKSWTQRNQEFSPYYGPGWARPMDLGGHDSSHHSRTLNSLVFLGLVKKRTRGSDRAFAYRWTGKEPTP